MQQIKQVLREAVSWGAVYGGVIAPTQWEGVRDEMVDQFFDRIVATQELDEAKIDQEVKDAVIATHKFYRNILEKEPAMHNVPDEYRRGVRDFRKQLLAINEQETRFETGR